MAKWRPFEIGAALPFLVSASSAAATVTAQPGKAEAIPVQVLGGDAAAVELRADNKAELLQAKFVFESAYGAMPLRRIDVYANDNASGYYTRYGGGNGDPFLMLYVYPANQPIANEVGAVKVALVDRLKATESENLLPALTVPGAAFGCFSGTGDDRQVDTCFWLVERDGWFLKVRLTVPRQRTADAIDVATRALQSIPWGWTPTTPMRPAN